jgi:UTP--glucose-1-phosphate uridylyltransferase
VAPSVGNGRDGRRVTKAVIPAAGWGTRFLPLTKAVPKEMVPILDAPAIHYVVNEAVRAGVEDITIVTGRHKRAIEDYFDRAPELEAFLASSGRSAALRAVRRLAELADFHFIRQAEPRGLGHAVSLARRHVGGDPFAVLLPDVVIDADPPCLAQMAAAWAGETLVAVHEVPEEDVERYGVVVPGYSPSGDGGAGPSAAWLGRRCGPVVDLVEKPNPASAPSRLAITGRYILHPDIFDALDETPPGAGGERQLTDALRRLCARRPVWWVRFTGRPFDLGHPAGFLEANIAFARKQPALAGSVAGRRARPGFRPGPGRTAAVDAEGA